MDYKSYFFYQSFFFFLTVNKIPANSFFIFGVGSQEGVVKVWDNNDGSLFLTVPEAGDEIGMIACGCDDDVIIVSSKTGISLISFETGEILQR